MVSPFNYLSSTAADSPQHSCNALDAHRPAWHPGSWRTLPISQQPPYEPQDLLHLENICQTLGSAAPLVTQQDIEDLRSLWHDVAGGQAFILQAGDCAERFVDAHPSIVQAKVAILQEMRMILEAGLAKPVVTMGRLAGQYWKPRSFVWENQGGERVPAFRGDGVHDFNDMAARKADPQRLLQAYEAAAQVQKYLSKAPPHNRVFTSHEALHLAFEEAFTRPGEAQHAGAWFNRSAHTLWVGDRTRSLHEAHIEYIRGVLNPIAIKIGPTAVPEEIAALARAVNPHGEKGRLMLITRFGAARVEELLPPLLKSLRQQDVEVLWCCDPMHGNTRKVQGIKTRDFAMIMAELKQTVALHRECGGELHGVHFEFTCEDVTECLGGPGGAEEHELLRRYDTYCDPRLNHRQSLELAKQLVTFLAPARLQ